MALKLASQMDKDTRIVCFLNGWVAVDEDCGVLDRNSNPIRLIRSRGRSKVGRPAKYWIMGTELLDAPVIRAFSDEEAVSLANKFVTRAQDAG